MLSKKGIFLLLFLFSFVSCAHDTTVRKETTVLKQKKPLTVQQQQEAAFKIFNRILKARKEAKSLEEAVKRTEPMYLEIIKEYPQAPLAQESSLRLIELYLRDYSPPAVEKAENIYKIFQSRYKQSPLREKIDRTLTRFFYANKMWGKIIEFHKERVKNFINTGRIDNPYYLFVFSEARYHTGNISEAIKGYKWIIKKFPQSHEAKISEKRLDLIFKDRGVL